MNERSSCDSSRIGSSSDIFHLRIDTLESARSSTVQFESQFWVTLKVAQRSAHTSCGKIAGLAAYGGSQECGWGIFSFGFPVNKVRK